MNVYKHKKTGKKYELIEVQKDTRLNGFLISPKVVLKSLETGTKFFIGKKTFNKFYIKEK